MLSILINRYQSFSKPTDRRSDTIQNRKKSPTYPSFSNTGSSGNRGSACSCLLGVSQAFGVEMTSRKCLTASTCFSVQNFLYNSPVYSSLQGCCEERELTKLPNDCIVLEISVSVRFVWASCKWRRI